MTEERIRSLSYAARPGAMRGPLGELLAVAGVLALVPLAVALGLGERHLLRPGSILAPLGLLALGLLLRGRRRPPAELQVNEAAVVGVTTFVVSPLAALPLFLEAGYAPVDALFEAVSGVTTTGLTTLATVADLPRAVLFARAWLQWIGGLGIVVLSAALLAGSGLAARRLEALTGEREDLAASTRALARRALVTYGALTAAGIALVAATGTALFDALCLTLSAVSTGGFAPRDASLGALAWPGRGVVTALCVLGAVPLPLYRHVRQGRPRVLLGDVEVRALAGAGLLVTGTLVLVWTLVAPPGATPSLAHAPLLALSAQTTAGFTTLDPAALDPASKLVLLLSMLVGGGVGSTAGGLKLLRLLVIFSVLRWVLQRTRLPRHAFAPLTLAGERLDAEDVQTALVVAAAFASAVALSWLPFLAAGLPPLDALFEVVSALGTVGLSTGVAGPDLAPGLKAVLCADMLLGRLEIVAVLVVLAPRTWIGRRRE